MFCSLMGETPLLRQKGTMLGTCTVTFDHMSSTPIVLQFGRRHCERLLCSQCHSITSYNGHGVRLFVHDGADRRQKEAIVNFLCRQHDSHPVVFCVVMAGDVFSILIRDLESFRYAWFVFYYMVFLRYRNFSFRVYIPLGVRPPVISLEAKIEICTQDTKGCELKHSADTIIVCFEQRTICDGNINPLHFIRDSVIFSMEHYP